ncbi:hypothetical protein GDO78_023100 [Eleutherodactylus coqui]|uniref:Uncharacterized protein n=1 Tax=Eleutherodactylus coqui TaxID=57060 RepID=A0A8J6BDA4_ELECQ|nr:hypothetical protein GDO78_023100 [Eleutherodactylus coqui]
MGPNSSISALLPLPPVPSIGLQEVAMLASPPCSIQSNGYLPVHERGKGGWRKADMAPLCDSELCSKPNFMNR